MAIAADHQLIAAGRQAEDAELAAVGRQVDWPRVPGSHDRDGQPLHRSTGAGVRDETGKRKGPFSHEGGAGRHHRAAGGRFVSALELIDELVDLILGAGIQRTPGAGLVGAQQRVGLRQLGAHERWVERARADVEAGRQRLCPQVGEAVRAVGVEQRVGLGGVADVDRARSAGTKLDRQEGLQRVSGDPSRGGIDGRRDVRQALPASRCQRAVRLGRVLDLHAAVGERQIHVRHRAAARRPDRHADDLDVVEHALQVGG